MSSTVSDPCFGINGAGIAYREFSCEYPQLEPFYFEWVFFFWRRQKKQSFFFRCNQKCCSHLKISLIIFSLLIIISLCHLTWFDFLFCSSFKIRKELWSHTTSRMDEISFYDPRICCYLIWSTYHCWSICYAKQGTI